MEIKKLLKICTVSEDLEDGDLTLNTPPPTELQVEHYQTEGARKRKKRDNARKKITIKRVKQEKQPAVNEKETQAICLAAINKYKKMIEETAGDPEKVKAYLCTTKTSEKIYELIQEAYQEHQIGRFSGGRTKQETDMSLFFTFGDPSENNKILEEVQLQESLLKLKHNWM